MYKITQFGSSIPIFESYNKSNLTNKFFPNSHLLLWKDNVFIGRIKIEENEITLILDNGDSLRYSKRVFQDLFIRNAQIIELVYRANSIKGVCIKSKDVSPKFNSFANKPEQAKIVRLFSYSQDGTFKCYGDLYYWEN